MVPLFMNNLDFKAYDRGNGFGSKKSPHYDIHFGIHDGGEGNQV